MIALRGVEKGIWCYPPVVKLNEMLAAHVAEYLKSPREIGGAKYMAIVSAVVVAEHALSRHLACDKKGNN